MSQLWLSLLLIQITQILAGYELQVIIQSFNNTDGMCADQACTGNNNICCEFGRCPTQTCDYFFSLCQRETGTPISYVRDEYQGDCSLVNTSHQTLQLGGVFTDMIFNITNPVIFTGMLWPDAGVQLFLEIIDHDNNPFELIDRFVINVTTPVGTTTPRTTYSGIFGLADIDMSFRVVCTENFFGPNCERLCLDNCTCDPGFTREFCTVNNNDSVGVCCTQLNQRCVGGLLNFSCECVPGYTGPDCLTDINDCTEDIICNNGVCIDGIASFTCACDPGFTGEFCSINIDDCVGVSCGQNQRCVDSLLNFTCECLPGYTDPDCLTDINECEDINCNNGVCVDGIASFTCTCDPGFTGQFCESQLRYELQVNLHSFSNTDGMCADQTCTGSSNICCEFGKCPTQTCDYFFSLCQREAGTPISYVRDEYQGNCFLINTSHQTLQLGGVFTDMVFNVTNPITFSGTLWPDAGVQLFMEIIDYDSGNNPDELIDRFVINVTTPVGTTTPRTTYSGIFGLADIDMNFRVVCTENFFGPNCEQLCLDNCTCDPGFTGEFCSIDIDDCVGVCCGQNQRCVDGLLNYTCDCLPGYECGVSNGIRCNNGRCLNSECVCDSGFAGQTCEASKEVDSVVIVAPVVGTLLLLIIITVIIPCLAFVLRRKNSKSRSYNPEPIEFTTYPPPPVSSQSEGYSSLQCAGEKVIITETNYMENSKYPSLHHRTESSANSYSLVAEPKLSSFSAPNPDYREVDDETVPAHYSQVLKENMDTVSSTNASDGEKENDTEYPSLYYRTESSANNYSIINKPKPSPLAATNPDYTEVDDEIADEVVEFYDYTPSPGDLVDDYDYESPFWEPSNQEKGLLEQFRKLKIRSVPNEALELFEVLGSGAFGQVHRGVWHHSESNQMVKEEVAVKSVEDGSNEKNRVKFLQEAAIMGQFNHPNIVRILGIMRTEMECKIVLELMLKGNLRGHLPELANSTTNNAELASQLLSYSRHVASGMSYLSLKDYVHRDLAARNVLISKDDICKIGDFGLSRDLNNESFYTSHGGMVPVKWTAPEALHYRKYSPASDVWSYGCVLYEIWSLGVKPFHNLSNGQVVTKIASKFRLPPPPGCPKTVYDVMIKCWNEAANLRPEFYDICSILNSPEYKVLKWSPEDIERYSEEARTLGAPLEEGECLFEELQKTYLS